MLHYTRGVRCCCVDVKPLFFSWLTFHMSSHGSCCNACCGSGYDRDRCTCLASTMQGLNYNSCIARQEQAKLLQQHSCCAAFLLNCFHVALLFCRTAFLLHCFPAALLSCCCTRLRLRLLDFPTTLTPWDADTDADIGTC